MGLFRTQSVRTRRFLLWLGGIAFVALALRFVVCLELSGHPSVRSPWQGTDMATYKRLAAEIAEGRFPDHYYYQPFYYSVFLPVLYRVCGVGVWPVLVAQALLGAGAVWLTGLIGARLFGRRAGLVAAALLCLCRSHMFYTPFLLLAVLQSFWMALLVYLVLGAAARGRWRDWLAVAVTAGAATLTRGNVILLLPGIALLFAWRHRRRPARVVAGILVLLAACYAPQLPFAWRNARHFGRWVGPSSAADAVLALGNTPEAPPGGLSYPRSFEVWMARASKPGVDRVPVSRQMLGWLRREPLAFAELKFKTFLLFWHRQEIPNNVSMAGEGSRSALLRAPLLVDFWLLGVLAVFGILALCRTRSTGRLFLYYTVVVYCLSIVLFYMLARFRVPVLPLLSVFAGGAVARGLRVYRRHRRGRDVRRPVLFGVLGLVSAVFIVVSGIDTYQQVFESAVMRLARPYGVNCVSEESLCVYDHGPLRCGGWLFSALPAEGMVLRKTLRIPADVQRAAPTGACAVHIPFDGQPGSRVGVIVSVAGGSTGKTEFELSNARGAKWCAVSVLPVPAPGDTVEVTVAARPLRGTVFLGLDRYRDYGRTLALGAGGVAVPTGSEAGIELEWTKGSDGSGSSP